MINRWTGFIACILVGGALGWWAAARNGIAFGLGSGFGIAALSWLVFDSIRLGKLLRWLRAEQSNDIPGVMAGAAPDIAGVWGEVADRARRLLRARDEQYQEIQGRLDEFLAAM